MSIIITIEGSTHAPVFCQYAGQCNPQPAYLSFDPSAEGDIALHADYSGEIGNAVPVDVWHRRILRFRISPLSSRESLLALADDAKLEALLEAVRAAYSCNWDGNNYVGTYDGLDDYFEEEIERHLDAVLAEQQVVMAEDWMDSNHVIKNLLKHGSIQKYADVLEDACEYPIIGDMEIITAVAVAYEIECHIRYQHEGDDNIRKAAELLGQYDAAEYGHLLAEYDAEFEAMTAEDIIEAIRASNGTIDDILAALKGGEALAAIGITDSTKPAVEEAIALILEKKAAYLSLYRQCGSAEIDGKEYALRGQPELSGRLFPGCWMEADEGEGCVSEWFVGAMGEDGRDYVVYWRFSEIKGAEGEPDHHNWDDAHLSVEV